MTKVIVIGIDGGTWRIIGDLIDKGKLPAISKLVKEGCSGNLESSIPSATFPGWKCYSTGKNPGKLGVYGWMNVDIKNKRIIYNDSTSFKSKELWDYSKVYGIKCGIIDMPTTYPTKEINGFMVSHSVFETKDYTYPKELEIELKQKFDYCLTPRYLYKEDMDLAIEECKEVTKKRFEIAKYLMNKYNPDFLHVTVFYSDHLQHYYWKYMENKDPQYGNVIEDFYIFVDNEIKSLLELSRSDDTHVILMSDHGFKPLRGEFSTTEWYIRKGYIKIKSRAILLRCMHRIGLNDDNIISLLNKIKITGYLKRHLPANIQFKLYSLIPDKRGVIGKSGFAGDALIDWNKSKMICIQGNFINTNVINDNEYEHFRDKVIAELYSIKDPRNGKRLFKNIYKREELYKGSYLDRAPDIVLVTNDKYIEGSSFGKKLWNFEKLGWSAHHDLYGIFCISGPGIKKGYEKDAKIYDLAPTILHIFGLPIPNDMDGKVLTEIFEPDSELAKRKPVYVDPSYYEEKKEKEKLKTTIGKLKVKGKV